MSDNDEVDDLVGAFEGDAASDDDSMSEGEEEEEEEIIETEQNELESSGPSKKKQKKQDITSSSIDKNSLNEKSKHLLSAADILSTKTSTSSLKHKKTQQQEKNDKDGGNKEDGDKQQKTDEKNDTKKDKEEEREVATGTSHDKSFRSYTAVPEVFYNDEDKSTSKDGDDDELMQTDSKDGPKTRPPAKVYPFELDPFQKQAVDYVEKGESVLVAAHTSAGKTAVAEYAVAKSLRDGQRVIYTAPIKALSNQKYRDLQEEFSDVGLMTGDITINPSATCLVMTTEILRSMLYRGSEVVREVAWVIYDEVHYMRDKDRGVVWEESIILLPHKVRFVFLSATIPNSKQFAHWIAKVHRQKCHVVYTNYRPVPLQHYIFPSGGEGLYLVVDEKGKFRESNFQKAMATLKSSDIDGAIADAMGASGNSKKGGPKKRKRGGNKGGSDLHRIVKLVMERNLNPVIVFSFSKKDCERYALDLKKEDYTDEVEKDLISQVYTNAIESLSEDDQKLPQVEALLPLLKRGIGIHHGGLLPILKEIVEILFSEGLIKCLFATETFAIGINMPAKTVVFTNCRKWDGSEFRWVRSGEYIQMSGRAGRRGKDDRGIVIQMIDEKMEPSVCKGILYGDPDPLNSSYRISYNMLLNMMRVEEVDPEFLLRASFHQFQQESEAPALEAQATELEEQASKIVLEDEDKVSEYYGMDKQLAVTQAKMMRIIRKPEYMVPYLSNPGRLLEISVGEEKYGWGVLVSYRRKTGIDTAGSAGKTAASIASPMHSIDVLVRCVDRHFDKLQDNDNNKKALDEDTCESINLAKQGLLWRGTSASCRPVNPNNKNDKDVEEMRLFTLGLDNIDKISAIRIFMPQNTTTPESRKKVADSIVEVKRRLNGEIPVLDPVEDLKVKGADFDTLVSRASALKERLVSHKLSEEKDEETRNSLCEQYGNKMNLLEEARTIRKEVRACQTMVMKEELKKMKRVLKHLGHVDSTGVIQTKGRTACEINTANELVVVELVFSGVLSELSVEQCMSLLSCMTFDERVNNDDGDPTSGLKSFLSNPFIKLQEVTRGVAKAAKACKIEIDEDEMVDKINPGMMEAVFAWCKGSKFVEIQKLTSTFEGNTIRTLRRLEELVRQITCAAKAIGNHELAEKFERGSEMLKRDIVFCSSLYL